jgi:hypothetical protein
MQTTALPTQKPPGARRRILSLDGGGVRGFFTIEVLARIEELLRKDTGRPDLVLADHFDLIAGTSTGAIIGTLLSWGLPVDWIREQYTTQVARMFRKTPVWQAQIAKYRQEGLSKFLTDLFREEDGSVAKLGSARLRTLLLVVLRNATQGSAWPLTNNPRALFNRRLNEDGTPHAECNLDLPLWQIVRASTAAPWYFPAEAVQIGAQRFVFVDGGITPYNNPALIAALTATLPCYKLGWEATPERLGLVSIGTGRTKTALSAGFRARLQRLSLALQVPGGLMETINQHQDMMCRVLGECRFGDDIDMEIGGLKGAALLSAAEKKFSYARYNKLFTATEIAGLKSLHGPFEMDNLKLVDYLKKTGAEYAAVHVRLEDIL